MAEERQDICGAVKTGGTGMEWICVKKPHKNAPKKQGLGRTRSFLSFQVDDEEIDSNNHYFVRKHPFNTMTGSK